MKLCLVGESLPYSYSAFIHKRFGSPYFIREVPVDEFDFFAKYNDLDGFNVTIPYKGKIVDFVDVLSPSAAFTSTVNTVVKKDGKIYGFNTDIDGFSALLKRYEIDVKNKVCLILGSGATSRTVRYVLAEEKASEILVVSRTGELNYDNVYSLPKVDIVINTTPVGTFPDVDDSPIDLSRLNGVQAVVDVIYNPLKTSLMLQAESLGLKAVGGLYMLVYQAGKSEELFTGRKITDDEINSVYKELKSKMLNVVLVGMASCGKSSVAKKMSVLTGRETVDTDFEIKRSVKKTPSDIIVESGEAEFRKIESEIVEKVSTLHGKVIATGGGSLTVEKNIKKLKHNGIFVYIERNVDDLSTFGRPLQKTKEDVIRLYKARTPVFERTADVVVFNDGDFDKVSKKAVEKLNEIISY